MKLANRQQLGYCTNVHPYGTVDELIAALGEYTGPLRERLVRAGRLARDERLGVGLWLPAPVAAQLARDADPVRRALDRLGLAAFTVNAFPYGAFHGEFVKDGVFRPGWADGERLAYTLDAAAALAALLPPEEQYGSVSTHTGGYKPWGPARNDEAAIAAGLRAAAEGLSRLEERTGRRIVLALEPEPLSFLETTAEVVGFVTRRLLDGHPAVTRHLGLCYDACHQAVQFEDAGESLEALAAAGIAVAKVQLSSAIHIDHPHEDRELLRPFAEDRWFHQVVSRRPDGSIVRHPDLPDALAAPPPAAGTRWRVHFHVPLFAGALDEEGRLGTTRDELETVLAMVADPAVTNHLEIETYSFAMIPEERRAALGAPGLLDCLEREFAWVLERHAETASLDPDDGARPRPRGDGARAPTT